jgi:hypothetical protein
MIQVETEVGTAEISAPLLRAIRDHGALWGDIMADLLDEWQRRSGEQPDFPAAFLLEWRAVLELGVWERQGFRYHQTAGLPAYREAVRELQTRAAQGPEAFRGLESAILHKRVLQYWTRHFACQAPELLDTPVAMSFIEEETFFDSLVEFLWKNRHRLSPSHNPNNYGNKP